MRGLGMRSQLFKSRGILLLICGAAGCGAQEAPTFSHPPSATQAGPKSDTQQEAVPVTTPVGAVAFDASLFLRPMQKADLAFLKQYDGAPASDLFRDKQFRKVLKNIAPDCTFHYGRDMSMNVALEMVMKESGTPVRVREGRYLTISGARGPYLGGRGFVWIDLESGIGLGGFYFHPTNGEPTPTLAVFSRQVKEDQLALSELPPAFVREMVEWSAQSSVGPVTTQYFITGGNKRVLLEHDLDFCSPADVRGAGAECEQMNADAADLDVTAAYYLDQVHYATNGTAWMIGPEQTAWIGVRERTCGGIVDPLGCRIRVDRERVRVITRSGGPGRPSGASLRILPPDLHIWRGSGDGA